MERWIILFVTTGVSLSTLAEDCCSWSQSPPNGLDPREIPMFVSLGFDDNKFSGLEGSPGVGGMTWATNFFKDLTNPPGTGNATTYDGAPVRVSFYATTKFIAEMGLENPAFVKRSWRAAYEDGHELGSHTHTHNDGLYFSQFQWENEMNLSLHWLSQPFNTNNETMYQITEDSSGIGVKLDDITGFRAPFLKYNANTFSAAQAKGFIYDNSIEDGWQYQQDGTNYAWPYTLDQGSPGHEYMVSHGYPNKSPIGIYPGLWEIPTHPVVVPPDSQAEKYGFSPGLRARVQRLLPWFSTETGKCTGFDYNLWMLAKVNPEEFVATLKYTLDLRLQGNRSPFTFGAHTDFYNTMWDGNITGTYERQKALEDFVLYAISKPEVRIVPHQVIVDWMRNPDRGTFSSQAVPDMFVRTNQTNTLQSEISFALNGKTKSTHNGSLSTTKDP